MSDSSRLSDPGQNRSGKRLIERLREEIRKEHRFDGILAKSAKMQGIIRTISKVADYNFMAIPVVDHEHHLVGIITHDDVIDVVGPLGRPFPRPQRRVNCLLVGGGYGAAPLYYLGEQLLRQGLRVDMIIGAATGERILGGVSE
jgi:hypothetical protein